MLRMCVVGVVPIFVEVRESLVVGEKLAFVPTGEVGFLQSSCLSVRGCGLKKTVTQTRQDVSRKTE